MNCQKAANLLSAYLDAELTPEERRQLRLHLLTCGDCCREFQELEAVKEALGSLTVTSIPAVIPWLRMRLAKEAEKQNEPSSSFIWQYPWFRRICTIAALLLLFGISSWLFLPQKKGNQASSTDNNWRLPTLPSTSWIDFRSGARR